MKVVDKKISISELNEMSKRMFGNFVKAVVDVEKEILLVDSELHSDMESFLLSQNSKQESIWGINIYPSLPKDQRIEFDSMINLRPSWGNSTRGVDDLNIQKKIIEIVASKITED